MIESSIELKHPKVEGGSIVMLELGPHDGEDLKEFNARMDRLVDGVHQMEFKKLRDGTWSLKIQLNPQWEQSEEVDDLANVQEAELLREFKATTAGTVQNKIDYERE